MPIDTNQREGENKNKKCQGSGKNHVGPHISGMPSETDCGPRGCQSGPTGKAPGQISQAKSTGHSGLWLGQDHWAMGACGRFPFGRFRALPARKAWPPWAPTVETWSVLSWCTRSASADWTLCFSRRQRHVELSFFHLSSLLGFAARARVSAAPESRVMAGRRARVCPASGQSGVGDSTNCPVSLMPSGALWRLMTAGNAMGCLQSFQETDAPLGLGLPLEHEHCFLFLVLAVPEGPPLRKGRPDEWGVGKTRPPRS